jgi:SAM-dependent methyltransferase
MPFDSQQQIDRWDRRMADLAAKSPAPDAKLLELVAALALEPARALDIGCGPGRHLVWLARHGWAVTGLDWSPQALIDARAALDEFGLSAELIHGDLRTPPDLGPPFRLAVATRVCHHGTRHDFILALTVLRSLLEPGGYAVLSLPSAALTGITEAGEWIEDGTFVPAEGDEQDVPHHFFTPEEVRQAAREFSAVEVHAVPEEYEEQSTSGPALIRREWLWVVLRA